MGIAWDVRLGVRALRRQPLFSSAAVLVLALSIGANASVFSLVKCILLQPLALKKPHELVALDSMRPDGSKYPFTIPYFLELRKRCPGLEEVAAYGGFNANLTGEADPQRVLGVRASGNYFPMLGVAAEVGRLLEAEDDQPGRPKVVVIADGLWRRLFGGDPAAIGKQLRLNGDPYTLVGVLPPSFQFKTAATEFAVALAPETDPFRASWSSTAFLRVFGRLAPGVTAAQASAALNTAAADIRREHPAETATIVGIAASPLRDFLTGDSRTLLVVLMCAVGLVLLIACANISSLGLARSLGRAQELSIRAALGASRWSIARQLLIENLVLFAAGGIAGVLLAGWGVRLLLSITPAELPRFREVQLDWTVVAAALAATMVCGILSSAIPALRGRAKDLGSALRSNGRGNTEGSRGSHLRAILVVVEAALSLALLAGTGLVLKSFDRLMAIDPGFRTDRLATFRLALPSTRYKAAEPIVRFHDLLRAKIQAIPGVLEVGSTSILPLSGPMGAADFTIAGRPPVSAKEKPTAQYRMVDPAYFRSMGIPLASGRWFSDTDTASSRPVVVISASTAALYWKGASPLGSRVLLEDNNGNPREVEVVGVVGDTRELSLEDAPAPCMYVAMPQIPQILVRFLTNNMFWAVRTENRVDVAAAVRRAIRELDGDVAVAATNMDQYISRAAAARLFALRILALFAAAALLLAAGGLYALVSFTTAQRSREFGVRLALGARRGDIAKLVMSQALLLAAAGVAAGAAATYAGSRLLGSLLFHVSPHDPMAIGAAAALLMAAALAACYAPVRRALRVDPVECLRSE